MAKKRINQLAEEFDVSINDLMRLKVKLDPSEWKGVGRNTWFTEEGAERLRLALDIPLAVPDQLNGKVLRSARNPNWVYAKIQGLEGAHPVAIPRKLKDKLIGKTIAIHAIEDTKGITYRHASLSRRN
jgi:hypothetical protein